MARAKQRKSPTRRGRPLGSRYGAVFPLRLSTDTEAAVCKWAVKQGITRSEAMHRLVELGSKQKASADVALTAAPLASAVMPRPLAPGACGRPDGQGGVIGAGCAAFTVSRWT